MWVEEETYFFRLSAYQKRLLTHYEEHPDFILPPEFELPGENLNVFTPVFGDLLN